MAVKDLTDDLELESVIKYIKRRPGCTFDSIYKNYAFSKHTLCLALNHLKGEYQKIDNLYFHKDATDTDIEAAIAKIKLDAATRLESKNKTLVNTNIDTPAPKCKRVKPAAYKIPRGASINKGTDAGVIAYLFYDMHIKTPGKGMIIDLAEAAVSNILRGNAYRIIHRLAKKEILSSARSNVVNPKTGRLFKEYTWSGKYTYPFTTKSELDEKLITKGATVFTRQYGSIKHPGSNFELIRGTDIGNIGLFFYLHRHTPVVITSKEVTQAIGGIVGQYVSPAISQLKRYGVIESVKIPGELFNLHGYRWTNLIKTPFKSMNPDDLKALYIGGSLPDFKGQYPDPRL